jgi:hypothetical protein
VYEVTAADYGMRAIRDKATVRYEPADRPALLMRVPEFKTTLLKIRHKNDGVEIVYISFC